jgi:hypothetical protein
MKKRGEKFTENENQKSRYNHKPRNQINPACACIDTIVEEYGMRRV